MEIKKESEINGVTARSIREKLKLSQKEFWGAVCVTNTRGCSYETGATPIPKPVRRLLYIHYVVGVPVDMSNRELTELAKVADPARRAGRKIAMASKLLDEASTMITRAKETMNASV